LTTTLLLLQIYPYYKESINVKVEKIGLIGKFSENNLPLSVRNKISLGITSLSPSGEATSSLAYSWTIKSNGLSYVFQLLDNLYWHDGKKFVADDVSYKLKDITFSPLSKNTVEVILKEPYAPILTNLSYPLMKPGLVGLGLYQTEKIKYSQDYISEIVLRPYKKNLPILNYKFYENTKEAILAFKMGEINKLEQLSNLEDLNDLKSIQVFQYSLYDRIVAVFLNLKNPYFKEKEVRQALNYAVPSFPDFEKAYTPISPFSWAYSNKIRLYKYDPETAQKILSKTILASSSSEITISTYASTIETAQKIADGWNKIGIKSKIKVESLIPSDYQAFLLTFQVPSDPDQYQFWQSTQEDTNITHYTNLKIDKLLEDGRKTLDKDTRKKIYADFQRYLVDDSPVIFLYFPKAYTVERK
jgi:peptide/nickel transport system substrate-binding protein